MVLPPSSLWLPEGCSQNIHVPSSHACLRPTKDSKLLIGHHRTMPKPQAQLLGPFICCQQLPTSPQLTLPVSHLKLQPHINTYSPCTFLALSPLLLLKFFSWPGMHCPSSSISKTQHKRPFLQGGFPAHPALGQASVLYPPQTPSPSASIMVITKVVNNFPFQ